MITVKEAAKIALKYRNANREEFRFTPDIITIHDYEGCYVFTFGVTGVPLYGGTIDVGVNKETGKISDREYILEDTFKMIDENKQIPLSEIE